MGGLLFVTQSMLDSWAGQGRIDFVGNVMTLLAGAGKGRSYALEPAVRFMSVVGAEEDPNGLLHRVKTLAHLRGIGAEPVDDSCILGDVAYEVEPGFLAEAAAVQAATAASPEAVRAGAQEGDAAGERPPARRRAWPGEPPAQELERRRKDAEALARFVLESLC